ncbi:probable tRNA-splicing endonuclease subunit Sen2 at C-terminar half [Coccomyxa sp. Obi]|nr:probable tRNA-splicing endonuclease subunit Sen2 at C-terminar half [Coccomyxa sp. Obi]
MSASRQRKKRRTNQVRAFTPQEALKALADHHLRGWLQQSHVSIEVDATVANLLECASLGTQSCSDHPQISRSDTKLPSKELGRAIGNCGAGNQPTGLEGAAVQQATCNAGEREKAASRPPAAAPRENQEDEETMPSLGAPLTSPEPGNADECLWGVLQQVGRLAGHDILLPVEVAARVVADPGIASLPAAVPKQQLKVGEEATDKQAMQVAAAHLKEAGSGAHADDVTKEQTPNRKAHRSPHAAGGKVAAEETCAQSSHVSLSLEEAFFLAHALRALTVSVASAEAQSPLALTCEELWARCLEMKHDFALSYIPFCHFRSKGWVVRPGAQYGVDYVLYSQHPAEVHSSYCLLSLMGRKDPSFLCWNDIEAANRTTTQVGKQLLLLYVDQQTAVDWTSPACLSSFTVEERLVKRWTPGLKDRTRD